MDHFKSDPQSRLPTMPRHRAPSGDESANDGSSSDPGATPMCGTAGRIGGSRSPPQLVAHNGDHESQLSRLVELEIIPRLMLLHRPSMQPGVQRAPAVVTLNAQHVEALSRLAAEGEASAAASYVNALLDAGASQEQVFLDLLAPTAKLLGVKWELDDYDFSQVTIGLWRLQQILYEHGGRRTEPSATRGTGRQALFSVVPGAQHTFGVAMAAEFFARDGWLVHQQVTPTWAVLKGALHAQWFDVLGVSAGMVDDVARLASAILDVRRVSMNPAILVIVGGPMAVIEPDLSGGCGADWVAPDAVSALGFANRWVSERGLLAK